ncbi:DUF2213 domain-containing protein [Escherichia coli]|nr:DUF2213 domain-containing protein [Escherichia coli]
MKYFFESQLGETRYLLADGSLLCKDVPIARTGTQLYSSEDLPDIRADPYGRITVNRMPEEVFSEETLASFEGMSVTVLHPEDDEGNILFINPGNWRGLAVGHLQNVRRGEGEQSDLVLADLVIKDEIAIALIDEGLREVSCGYNAEYQQLSPGKANQKMIRGNHVALVDKARAGNRCKIGDSHTMATSKKNWLMRLKNAIRTGDADTASALLEEAPPEVTGDSGDSPSGVNLNINLPPQQPLPDKSPEMGGSENTADGDDDLKTLLRALLAKLEGQQSGDSAGDVPEQENDTELTGDSDGEDKEQEAIVTGDMAYRAELITPGIDLSRRVKPTAFKRRVLASADHALVRQVVGDACINDLPKFAVDMAFNAVSELAKGRNTRPTTDARPSSGTLRSISELNKAHAAFWEKHKG